jgi:hypothetical protein
MYTGCSNINCLHVTEPSPSATSDELMHSCAQCKNPKRDLPVGIVGSLVVTTLLYVATALVRPPPPASCPHQPAAHDALVHPLHRHEHQPHMLCQAKSAARA